MSLNSEPTSTPQCSICLDSIITGSGRSTATLSCSHLFHLDCIGSEFNCKGVMQCPNCRLVEQGNWRFAAGNFLEDIMNDDEEDQENNPHYIDRVLYPAPLRSFMPNEFPYPPSQTIRNHNQLPTPPALYFTGISQLPQNVWGPQTHHNPLSDSFSITIGTPLGHEIGITLGTSSLANFAHPGQAQQQARPQGTGSPVVQNFRTIQQQRTPGPSAPNVPVRAEMSQNIIPGLHSSVPQPAFNPIGSRQPPRQETTIITNAHPSQPEGDENNVPMFRFL